MDRSESCQHSKGSVKEVMQEKTGCKVIFGAPNMRCGYGLGGDDDDVSIIK